MSGRGSAPHRIYRVSILYGHYLIFGHILWTSSHIRTVKSAAKCPNNKKIIKEIQFLIYARSLHFLITQEKKHICMDINVNKK